MLSLSLLTLGLATIGAYAKPTTRASGGLEISLSTPADTVASVFEIRVVAAVKNIGDEDLTIRKFGTVLDKQHPTRSFVVTKDGKDVPFTGFKVCAHSLPSASPASPTIYIVGKSIFIITVLIGLVFHRYPLRERCGYPCRHDGDCRARW